MRFHRVKAPTIEELSSLVHQLSHRVTRVLEKKGWLQRDDENTYLLLDAIDQEDDALGQLQDHFPLCSFVTSPCYRMSSAANCYYSINIENISILVVN